MVDVRTTQVQFQLSDEERQEAERIAGQDHAVKSYLAGRSMNPLTRLYFPAGCRPLNIGTLSFLFGPANPSAGMPSLIYCEARLWRF